ncbi:MAG: hypothetical protein LBR05_00430 [Azoarcus sp.]|nr:hypothetical protein [Azoarcus sp.]
MRHWYMVLLAALLGGCSSTDMRSTLDTVVSAANKSVDSLVSGMKSGGGGASSAASANSLLKSPLYNVMRENPSTDGSAPEWPKVVITNLQIPAAQLESSHSLHLGPDECIIFDAMLWRSAKKSERFKDLTLCSQELPKQSNAFVTTWKVFNIYGNTTGQVRGDGPTPPYSKLPYDQKLEQWISLNFGLYYIGSLLTLTGYDPNFSRDTRRFWVKNIK